jgi:hypothetical protein
LPEQELFQTISQTILKKDDYILAE